MLLYVINASRTLRLLLTRLLLLLWRHSVGRFIKDSSDHHDYIEGVVCKQEDLNENEMKMLPLGDEGKKILLIKQKGEFHALGTKCTHYGALLHTGALGEGRVKCPWHGACFNIKTGDIEDYPGFDSLPCYQVRVEAGQVHVRAKRKDLDLNKRIRPMSVYDPNNTKTVVIVGGGPAGAMCADNLRQEGFTGRIVMVCKENIVAYDRVKLSKMLDFDIQKSVLRPLTFYNENNIEVKLGVEAVDLDTTQKTVKLSNKENLKYDYLFICTGNKARMLTLPGYNLSNIFTLRDYTDAQNLYSSLSLDKHVIVIGVGFIGMEVAAICIDKCASITMVGRDVPLRPIFGLEIGKRIQKIFESKGIKFILDAPKQFIAREDNNTVLGKVEFVNQTLPADIVIIAVGSIYYSDWLKNSSVQLANDGSIVVDEYLRTNTENVYAGGDIAYAPIYGTGKSGTLGHYGSAHYHGRIAALNICGKETPLKTIPFFWTKIFSNSYKFTGFGVPTRIIIHGSLDKLEFFAFHVDNGKVIGMSSTNADPVVADFTNMLYEGKTLTEEEIKINPFGWMRSKPKDLSRFQNIILSDI